MALASRTRGGYRPTTDRPGEPSPTPRGATGASASPSPVPGREPELAALVARHRDLETLGGGPRLVVLRGPAGVGLADLVRGLGAELRLEGVPLLGAFGGAAVPRSALAHRALAPVVRDALAFLRERGRAPTPDHLVGLGCAEGCHALWLDHDPSLPEPQPPSPAAPPLDPLRPDAPGREARYAFVEAVARLLAGVSAIRPPAVCVGDLGKLDLGSREVLRLLLEMASFGPRELGRGPGGTGPMEPSALLLAYVEDAPDADDGDADSLAGLARTEVVRVGPLDEAGLRRFLTHPTIVERLLSATGGMPEGLERWLAADPPPAARAEAVDGRAWGSSPAGADGLRQALDRARALDAGHAPEEAAAVLAAALESCSDEDSGDVQAARTRLAELEWTLGRPARSLAWARQVAAEAVDDPWASLRVAYVLRFGGDGAEVADALDEAERRARRADDPEAALEVTLQRAEFHYRGGAFAEAHRVASAGLEEALRRRLPAAAVDARNTLGKVALAESRLEEAAVHFDENVSQARAASLRRRECQARNNRAIVALRRGDLARARDELDAAVDLAARHGAVYHRAVATENLAVLLHMRGELGEAHARYQDAVRLLKLLGDRDMLARAAVNLAELHLDVGDLEAARGLARFGVHVGGPKLADVVAAEAGLCAARVEMGRGRHDDAEAELAEVARRLPEKDELLAFRWRLGRAELALARGDTVAARTELDALPPDPSPRQGAQRAIVAAALARADGRDPAGAARAASDAAEAVGDDRLRGPAAVAEARAYEELGDLDRARAALRRASVLEHRLGNILPRPFRDRFTTRPEARRLAELAARLEAATGPGEDEPPAGGSSMERSSSLETLFYRSIRDGDASIYDVRKALERDVVARALAETDGNITRAARLLGMKRPRLSQLLKEYGAQPEGERDQ